jgi:hypothetical protein
MLEEVKAHGSSGVIKTIHPGLSSLDGLTFEERREIVTNWEAHRERIQAGEEANNGALTTAYRALSLEPAQELARVAIERYDAAPAKDSTESAQFLARLANFVSGALANEYPEILARAILWPDSIYQGADAPTRDKLLTRAKAGEEQERNGVLCALAWIGDDVVQAQFAAVA